MEFSALNQDKYRLIHTDEIWYRNKKFLNQLKKHKKLAKFDKNTRKILNI